MSTPEDFGAAHFRVRMDLSNSDGDESRIACKRMLGANSCPDEDVMRFPSRIVGVALHDGLLGIGDPQPLHTLANGVVTAALEADGMVHTDHAIKRAMEHFCDAAEELVTAWSLYLGAVDRGVPARPRAIDLPYNGDDFYPKPA